MNLTEIFCDIDDFFKNFTLQWNKRLINNNSKRNRKTALSESEIMTILVYFHFSGYRTFKHYYQKHVLKHLKKEFPDTLSYNRFVELIPRVIVPLLAFLNSQRRGRNTGISFVDSTILKACHVKRELSNKVFKNIATKGKSTMGWFYGFKLHLVINDKGEIIDFYLSAANVDDRDMNVIQHITKSINGKLFGDKGYISKKLFDSLFKKGIMLITKLRKNMKNKLMPIMDKIMLRKRALIESVNDELKNICQIEHTRHRSPANFIANLVSGLIAYSYLPKKPSIRNFNKDNSMIFI